MTQMIEIEPTDDLNALGVQPGWFARYGSCSIWFEVLWVSSNMVGVVARDPKKGTDIFSVGRHFSALARVTDTRPKHENWIAADRMKNFRDKFYPNDGKISV
jgi:hypothetical protein